MANILIVDDDQSVHGYLDILLTSVGHTVRHAFNGFEGVRVYEQEPADLVICEVFMELKDGLETIRDLVKRHFEVKIIAITGGSSHFPEDYLEYAQRFGALAGLPKPFDRERLLATVESLLSSQAVAGASGLLD